MFPYYESSEVQRMANGHPTDAAPEVRHAAPDGQRTSYGSNGCSTGPTDVQRVQRTSNGPSGCPTGPTYIYIYIYPPSDEVAPNI